ncbi:hypothetical protein Fleli_1695 [Bernardetia litoralis DSM 6794]|uniref:Uncharacterized protein n=1 Tax=Bernardetia litoralis (strain ATCC 23117 / DSM 6794 / NBRC 15988 / NCIMB 1366 / Fx l1 / Sio-4) TaxID=880071 RepID=I4AJG8_BERLS|nr:hypothetical protein [Bernardetia litoralis]AFM04103.1 hypothetical protein Fleli_1695 [Bernardetia litoralis DSM 6794]
MKKIIEIIVNIWIKWLSMPIKYKWMMYILSIIYTIWSELFIGVNRFFPLNFIGAFFILIYFQNGFFLASYYPFIYFEEWKKEKQQYLQIALLLLLIFFSGYIVYKIPTEIKKYEMGNNSQTTNSIVIQISDSQIKYEFWLEDGQNYKGWTRRKERKLGDKVRVQFSKRFPALNRESEQEKK